MHVACSKSLRKIIVLSRTVSLIKAFDFELGEPYYAEGPLSPVNFLCRINEKAVYIKKKDNLRQKAYSLTCQVFCCCFLLG